MARRATRGDLQKALEAETLRGQHALEALEKKLTTELRIERTSRIAAQRGLVPYVRSLELFDKWLKDNPTLREQLQPVLTALGLWEIRLGYDPDKDVDLTVAGAHRH